MKHNLENLPEVSIDKVDAFYVTGTQHRDAAGKTNNLKLNLKNSAQSGSLIDTISKMSGAERRALKAALDAPDANGHEYVDLGLQSGTLWATKFVGQDEQHPAGALFTWGDPVAIADPDNYDGYTDYKYWNNDYTGFTKYNDTDGKTTLDLEDDAAHVNMGGDWRMPSTDQLQELIDYCDVSVDTDNNLVVFTSKVNANTLIVPYYRSDYGGYYDVWSRNIDSTYENFYGDSATEMYGSVTEQEIDSGIGEATRCYYFTVLGVLGNENQDSDSDKQCDCVPTIEVRGYTAGSVKELKAGSYFNHSTAEQELGPIFYGIVCGKFPAIKVHLVDDDITCTLTKFVPENLDNNQMYDGSYTYPSYVMMGTEVESVGSNRAFCSEVRFRGGSGQYSVAAFIQKYEA